MHDTGLRHHCKCRIDRSTDAWSPARGPWMHNCCAPGRLAARVWQSGPGAVELSPSVACTECGWFLLTSEWGWSGYH